MLRLVLILSALLTPSSSWQGVSLSSSRRGFSLPSVLVQVIVLTTALIVCPLSTTLVWSCRASLIHLLSHLPSQTFSQEQLQEFPCRAIPPGTSHQSTFFYIFYIIIYYIINNIIIIYYIKINIYKGTPWKDFPPSVWWISININSEPGENSPLNTFKPKWATRKCEAIFEDSFICWNELQTFHY